MMTGQPKSGVTVTWKVVGLVAKTAVVAIMLVVPFSGIGRYELGVLTQALVIALAVIGFDAFSGYTGRINFGVAGFVALGAYTYAILHTTTGLGYMTVFLIVVVGGVLISFALSLLFLRLKDELIAMATLVFGLVVYHASFAFYEITGGDDGIRSPDPTVAGTELEEEVVYLIALGILLVAFWALGRLYHSRVGRALTAVRLDEPAAITLGIAPAKYLRLMFVISGAVMILAGWLFAQTTFRVSSTDFGLLFTFDVVIMGILGGQRGRWALFIGVALMTWIDIQLAGLENWGLAVYGVILLVLVFVLPGGLASLVHGLWSRFRGRRTPWARAETAQVSKPRLSSVEPGGVNS